MLASVLFIAFIFLVLYTVNLSNRLTKLENALKYGATSQVAAEKFENAQITKHTPVLPPIQNTQQTNADIFTSFSSVQWVAGIGIVALLFGLAFFFKFAIDQGWISEWIRVGIGIAVGSLFITLGYLWIERFKSYAQILFGGGIALLFFTIYAALQFYSLVTIDTAFLAMVFVTVLSGILSFRLGSKALVSVSVLGGFLAPFLVSFGGSDPVKLFIYLSLLNIGLVVLASRKFWADLLFGGSIATLFAYLTWAAVNAYSSNVWDSVAFLGVNLGLYFLIPSIAFGKMVRAGQKIERNQEVAISLLYAVFGASVNIFLTWQLRGYRETYLPLILLLCGGVTFMSYALVDRLNRTRINYSLAVVGAKFTLVAILWQFGVHVENLYLLAASALAIGVGFGVPRKELRTVGLVIWVLTMIKILLNHEVDQTFLLNPIFGVAMLGAVVSAFVCYWYGKTKLSPDEENIPAFLQVATAVLIGAAVSREIILNFDVVDSSNASNLLLSVWWMVYAVFLSILGSFGRFAILRKVSVLIFALAVVKVFTYDVLALSLGYRIVSFILLGVILLSLAFYYQRHKDKMQKFWEGERAKLANPPQE